MTVYELNVGMTCDGCSGAIKRILGKVESIKEVDCDIPNRKVTVKATADDLDIAEMLAKWVSIFFEVNTNFCQSASSGKSVEFVRKTTE